MSSPENLNPVHQLEHDHVHLSQLVDEVRALLSEAEKSSIFSAAQYSLLQETLVALQDDLLTHFAKEEEGLFPFLDANLPDTVEAAQNIADAHDHLCGTVSRMLHLVQRGHETLNAARPTLVTLFQRFVDSYSKHAQEERLFLRGLPSRLTHTQLAELLELLKGL